MMQSYASAAKLRSGGPILPFGIESQGNTSGLRHLEPSSATRHQDGPAETVGCPSVTPVHYAGRSTTPSGTTPSHARRHRAISSLRAKATIMVLRVPRALSVRPRNHCAKVLSFWNMRNRHANWIMPRRTRALPERVSPFSRRFLPLSSGEPVRPAKRATARRSRMLRDSTSCTNMSAVSTPTRSPAPTGAPLRGVHHRALA
jgi:hypothetical protein